MDISANLSEEQPPTRRNDSNPRLRWGIYFGIFLVGLLVLLNLERLSFNVWLGATAAGLCLSLVAIGVFISFRVLDCPDLTIDGSLPLGGAISATLIVHGFSPYFSLPSAFIGGFFAGAITGIITTRLRIHSLLASILTTTALVSINLRIMGRSNIPLLNEPTIFSLFADSFRMFLRSWGGERLARLSNNILTILLVGFVILLVKLSLDVFMKTELGLVMLATGDNPQMIRALGTNTDKMIILGLGISNGLVGLSGAIFAQYQGFSDVNMGFGLIIAGLAAVILGETIFRPKRRENASAAVIFGMIIYRIAIVAALTLAIPLGGGKSFHIEAQDVKLATALLVLIALWSTRSKKGSRIQV